MIGGYVKYGSGVDDGEAGQRGGDEVQSPSAHVDAGYVNLDAGNVSESVGADVDGVGECVEVANVLDGLSVKSAKDE